jgi:hypothetical protein
VSRREELKEIRTTGAAPAEAIKPPVVEPPPIKITVPDRIERLEQRKALGTGIVGRVHYALQEAGGTKLETARIEEQMKKAGQNLTQSQERLSNLGATINNLRSNPGKYQIETSPGVYRKVIGSDIDRLQSQYNQIKTNIGTLEDFIKVKGPQQKEVIEKYRKELLQYPSVVSRELREARLGRHAVAGRHEYIVTWMENGIEQKKTFDSQVKAQAFIDALSRGIAGKVGEGLRPTRDKLNRLNEMIKQDIKNPDLAAKVYNTAAPLYTRELQETEGIIDKALDNVWKWSEERYKKGGYPSKEDYDSWLKTASPSELIGATPFAPKSYEEWMERIGYVASQGLLGAVSELTFPVGLVSGKPIVHPPVRETDVWARIAGGLLTPTPMDYVFTKVVGKLVKTARGSDILKKIARKASLSGEERKVITELWENEADNLAELILPSGKKVTQLGGMETEWGIKPSVEIPYLRGKKWIPDLTEEFYRTNMLKLFGEFEPSGVSTIAEKNIREAAEEYAKWFNSNFGKAFGEEIANSEAALKEYANLRSSEMAKLYDIDLDITSFANLSKEEIKKLIKNATELEKFWREHPEFFTTGAAYTPIQVLAYQDLLSNPETVKILQTILSEPSFRSILPGDLISALTQFTPIRFDVKPSMIPDIIANLKKIGLSNADINKLKPFIVPIPSLDLDTLAKSIPKLSDEMLETIIPKLDPISLSTLKEKLTPNQRDRIESLIIPIVTPIQEPILDIPQVPELETPTEPPPETQKLKIIIPEPEGFEEKKLKTSSEETFTVKFTDVYNKSETITVNAVSFREAYQKSFSLKKWHGLQHEVDIIKQK